MYQPSIINNVDENIESWRKLASKNGERNVKAKINISVIVMKMAQ
jgi:hypothetical protein